jgi:1-phosphofructokinase family hexose kinase
MIYCVQLHPAIDHVVSVSKFCPGTTQRIDDSWMLPAGKGLNVARTVALMGEPVRLIGFMGGHDTPFFTDYAETFGIKCVWTMASGRVRENITLLDASSGAVTHLQGHGLRVNRTLVQQIAVSLSESIRPDDWVVFSGSLPAGAHVKTYRELIALSSERGANCLLDTSGKALFEGIRGKPFGIKPNQIEFEGIYGEKINGIRHTALKAKSLLDKGLHHIFVSLGSDGLVAINSSQLMRARLEVENPINTVGCGDALLGGLVTGLHRKMDFESTCRLGVACGAAQTRVTGQECISKQEVARFQDMVELMAL